MDKAHRRKARITTDGLLKASWQLRLLADERIDKMRRAMLKVLISYDMQTGKERECQDYLVNKLAPGLARLGFRISDVWYTMWGSSPQILSGGVIDDLAQAQKIFQSSAWEKLADGMGPLTENFHIRIVKPQPEE